MEDLKELKEYKASLEETLGQATGVIDHCNQAIEDVLKKIDSMEATKGKLLFSKEEVLASTARLKNGINVMNGGDNGFKFGVSNVFPIWDHKLKTFTIVDLRNAETQSLPSWIYLRTQAGLEKLLATHDFVIDWKRYNGIPLD